MAMITCPNCGEQISDKAKSCVHCGASLQPEEKRVCEECGTELEEGMEVCPVCGCPIAQSGGVTMDTPQQVEVTGVRMTKKMKKIALIEELLEKLKSSNEIAAVKNIKLESDTLKLRLLDEIEDYERSHQPTEPRVRNIREKIPKQKVEPVKHRCQNRLQHRKRNEKMCPSAAWQGQEPILWRMNRILTDS